MDNVREWFENGIVNLAVKSPNLELEADPGFKDATRGLLSWLQKKAGLAAPDYLAGYAYFRGLLGFDQSKKTLKPENEIPLTPGDLVSWVREGYTTGNPLLAVSGIDGGHIGIGVFDTGEPGQEVEKSSHLRFTRPSFGSGVTE